MATITKILIEFTNGSFLMPNSTQKLHGILTSAVAQTPTTCYFIASLSAHF